MLPPSLTPIIYDNTAPDAQKCPGYKASNQEDTAQGFTAHLTIAGANCQAYGNDISDLLLEVQYQTMNRLDVRTTEPKGQALLRDKRQNRFEPACGTLSTSAIIPAEGES
ncbi:Alpha-glucosidase [Fulvia fulva]|uniref:Alpha-glucosidase n=1 Tax=Passalora fulva TaxID=5499 RepID=A0A9Q8LGJ3_PASFU|nr:Alpha-glucosidase [Fulvia fulva]KAK4627842.1 hypothetical protein CLAFUR0_04619 [Fulvia fulva]UJO16990.1 Alpha-glucosidase [Fulvia fulva]WPV28166.1 hypothetical protein CLAFUW7_04623 [Fulvia fulva]